MSVGAHNVPAMSKPRIFLPQERNAILPSAPLCHERTTAMTKTLFLDLGSDVMDDVFLVISEARNGKRSARCVLAGDEDQARHAHLEHYPDEQIVTVRPQRTPA
jgi:hypothetical protein